VQSPRIRIGNPFLSHTLFAVYLGVALWVAVAAPPQPCFQSDDESRQAAARVPAWQLYGYGSPGASNTWVNDMRVLSEYLPRTCLAWCDFLELSKSVLAQFRRDVPVASDPDAPEELGGAQPSMAGRNGPGTTYLPPATRSAHITVEFAQPAPDFTAEPHRQQTSFQSNTRGPTATATSSHCRSCTSTGTFRTRRSIREFRSSMAARTRRRSSRHSIPARCATFGAPISARSRPHFSPDGSGSPRARFPRSANPNSATCWRTRSSSWAMPITDRPRCVPQSPCRL
jgi:hypothetical protein